MSSGDPGEQQAAGIITQAVPGMVIQHGWLAMFCVDERFSLENQGTSSINWRLSIPIFDCQMLLP